MNRYQHTFYCIILKNSVIEKKKFLLKLFIFYFSCRKNNFSLKIMNQENTQNIFKDRTNLMNGKNIILFILFFNEKVFHVLIFIIFLLTGIRRKCTYDEKEVLADFEQYLLKTSEEEEEQIILDLSNKLDRDEKNNKSDVAPKKEEKIKHEYKV